MIPTICRGLLHARSAVAISASQMKNQIMATIAVEYRKIASYAGEVEWQLCASIFLEAAAIFDRQKLIGQLARKIPVQRIFLERWRQFACDSQQGRLASHEQQSLCARLRRPAQCGFEVKWGKICQHTPPRLKIRARESRWHRG